MVGGMDFKHVGYFIDTANFRSMVKAAKQNGISQPAVSYAVQSLEESLGASLFRRGEQGLRLTPFGEEFYRNATEFNKGVLRGVNHVRSISREENKQLRVGNSVDCASHALSQSLSIAVKKEIGDVTPVDLTSRQCISELKLLSIDLAVVSRRLNPDDYEILESDAVTDNQAFVFLPEHHPLARNAGEISIEELSKLPLVTLNQDVCPGHLDDLEQNFKAHSLPFRIAQVASNERTVASYAHAGIGAGIVVGGFVKLQFAGLRRMSVPELVVNVPRRIEIVWRRNANSRTLTDFRQLLIKQLRP